MLALIQSYYDIMSRFIHHNLHGILITLSYVVHTLKLYINSHERTCDKKVAEVSKYIIFETLNILNIIEIGAPSSCVIEMQTKVNQIYQLVAHLN